MTRQDPNIAKVELIAAALGNLREQLVLVGGCAAGLLLTDPAAASARVTFDVDLVAEVAALASYYALEKQFARLGFVRDISPEAPICRWRMGALEVDLMPMDSRVLGFANRWYPIVVATAQVCALPSGTSIRLIAAPAFVATKFEAFADRGGGDMLASHDLEDIVNVIDGRPGLRDEVAAARHDLRTYVSAQCTRLLQSSAFLDALPGLVFPDAAHAARLDILKDRIGQLAAIG